jgi:hypothetical protein
MHGGGEQLEYVKVQDIVGKYFKSAEDVNLICWNFFLNENFNHFIFFILKKKNKLTALTEKGLSDAIQEFIEKDEKDAISELINFQIEKIQVKLINYKCK